MAVVFSDKTVAALRSANFETTVCFLERIVSLWNMINVKRKGCDILLNDTNRSPFMTIEDSRLQEMLQKMRGRKGFHRKNSFTSETKDAFVNTVHGMVDLIKNYFLRITNIFYQVSFKRTVYKESSAFTGTI